MSPVAFSSSDFISLFSTSNTSGESIKPFLCVASVLVSPEEVVLLMIDVVRFKCSSGS